MWDYDEDSVIRVWDLNSPDGQSTYRGLAEIQDFFVNLFDELEPSYTANDFVIPVEKVRDGMVFLVWTAVEAGIPQATDTFLFKTDGVTILDQNIVVNRDDGGVLRRRLLDTHATDVAGAWENHFEAFAAQDLDRIMLDYTDTSEVRVYNFAANESCTTDCEVLYTGTGEIRDMFEVLFAELWDLSCVGVPLVNVTNSMVFLVWENPCTGHLWATDTFGFDGAKIQYQNIVLEANPIPEPEDPPVEEEEPEEEETSSTGEAEDPDVTVDAEAAIRAPYFLLLVATWIMGAM
jgi:hypothetical protein